MKNTILTIMLLFAFNASAELIETTNPLMDSTFIDVGDSHWDTTTGLEWLDFGSLVEGPMTFGHSINTAVDAYDIDNGDWRLATFGEIYTLWDRFFPSYDGGTTGTMSIGEGDGATPMIQSRNSWIFAFGTDAEVTGTGTRIEITDENSALSSRGWYIAGDGSVQMMGLKIATNSIEEDGGLNTTFYGPDYQWDGLTQDSNGGWAGVYMVRDYTVVPIPAAIWLFGTGLLALIGVARRRA